MSDQTDAEPTLPSLVASLPGHYRDQQLLLTIVFHSCTCRIGQSAVVPADKGNTPWVLGRGKPLFDGLESQSPEALQDPYISRQALEFTPRGKHLLIRRFDASSRCQVAGRELQDSVELSPEQLAAGVPLLLGHGVVLLLRLGRRGDPGPESQGAGGLLCGSSAYMAGLRQQIAQAAASDLDVLIRGETGTGKELVATAIHQSSRRAGSPLVSVNMSAIPRELAPAALFGSLRGAFTGAEKTGAGYFQQAQGGTLFLDEVGDTDASVQPQLLRALQQREIQVVGGQVRRVDLRVISATDAELEGESCDFKTALRHRLGACEIHVLPLRAHPEDLGELLVLFLTASAEELGRTALLPDQDSDAPRVASWAGLFYRFLCYAWPGNIRELSNYARQVMLASEEELTLPDTVLAALGSLKGPAAVTAQAAPGRRKMQDVDEREFERVLQDSRYEPARAAVQLGVSRSSVYRRLGDSPHYRLASEVPQEELQQTLRQCLGDCVAAAQQLRVSSVGLRARVRGLDMEWH